MKSRRMLTILVLALGLMACSAKTAEAVPMGTAFTYQGFLMDKNNPAEDKYDFQFSLYNDPYTDTQEGNTIDVNAFDVNDGYFMVDLDFGGDVFTGDARWLGIEVRRTDSGDPFTPLDPRVRVTLTPYALYTLSAEDANTVDGHDAGNSAEQVAVNNGTLCTNLNADMLDDFHASYFAQTGHVHHSLDAVDGSPTDVVYVDSAGNVGVGTTSPAEKLDVNGTIKAAAFMGDGSGLTNLPVAGIPTGVIVMWSGAISDIPSGWALCDGNNGTPDLTSRFIRSVPNALTNPGARGGSSTHTHGAGSYTASSHTHTGTAGNASDTRWVDDHSGGDDHWVSGNSHTHSFETDPGGGGTITGTSAEASNLPPFFELAYIMRLPD